MGQRIDLTQQVQGILPEANGGVGPNIGQRFVDAETPSGATNGANTAFTLVNAPSPALSLLLFLRKTGAGDATLQIQGIDYTLSGASISMTTAPPGTTAAFKAWYRYLGFALSFSFSDGLSMSDNISTDALVSAFPLSLEDDMSGIMVENLRLVMPPNIFAELLSMSDSIKIGYGDSVPDSLEMKSSMSFRLSPIKVFITESLTMNDKLVKTLT